MFKNLFSHPTSQEVAIQDLEAARLGLLKASADLAYCQAMVAAQQSNIQRLEAVVAADEARASDPQSVKRANDVGKRLAEAFKLQDVSGTLRVQPATADQT